MASTTWISCSNLYRPILSGNNQEGLVQSLLILVLDITPRSKYCYIYYSLEVYNGTITKPINTESTESVKLMWRSFSRRMGKVSGVSCNLGKNLCGA